MHQWHKQSGHLHPNHVVTAASSLLLPFDEPVIIYHILGVWALDVSCIGATGAKNIQRIAILSLRERLIQVGRVPLSLLILRVALMPATDHRQTVSILRPATWTWISLRYAFRMMTMIEQPRPLSITTRPLQCPNTLPQRTALSTLTKVP